MRQEVSRSQKVIATLQDSCHDSTHFVMVVVAVVVVVVMSQRCIQGRVMVVAVVTGHVQ